MLGSKLKTLFTLHPSPSSSSSFAPSPWSFYAYAYRLRRRQLRRQPSTFTCECTRTSGHLQSSRRSPRVARRRTPPPPNWQFAAETRTRVRNAHTWGQVGGGVSNTRGIRVWGHHAWLRQITWSPTNCARSSTRRWCRWQGSSCCTRPPPRHGPRGTWRSRTGRAS
jgi:hypothetical protein